MNISTNVIKDLPKKGAEEKVASVPRMFTGNLGRSLRNASSSSGLSYIVDVIYVVLGISL